MDRSTFGRSAARSTRSRSATRRFAASSRRRAETPCRLSARPGARSLETLDLSGVSKDLRETEVLRRARAEAARPFDLERGPLLRTILLRLSAGEHVLLVTFHHVVFDAWSARIFAREMAAFYDAFREGRTAELPALPIQYADFAEWQRASLEGELVEDQLEYWRRQTHGAPTVIDLPADRARPAVQTFAGAEETVSIPKPVADAIRAISHREGATLFMTLLAAFQVFLHRHGAQEDMLIGSPVSGRNRSEVEGLIGFFVNTLVFRADVSGDPTFRELLGRVRETALEAYTHDGLPFERLVEELNPDRTLSHSPLVQVMMVLQDRAEPLALSGLSSTPDSHSSRDGEVRPHRRLRERRRRAHRFLPVQHRSLRRGDRPEDAGRLNMLLAGIVANPDSQPSRLPILTEEERELSVVRWNDTRSEYPREKARSTISSNAKPPRLRTPRPSFSAIRASPTAS